MTIEEFSVKCSTFWTADKIKKITGGKAYPILPSNAGLLLRTLGLLNQDASMSADNLRKFTQINHMIILLEPFFKELLKRHSRVRILDAGCGNSYLTFLLAWCFKFIWNHDALIVGVDKNQKIIAQCQSRALQLGLEKSLKFFAEDLSQIDWKKIFLASHEGEKSALESLENKEIRPHAVVALHACDTATDDALALGVEWKADFVAVAPCCQAELARKWKTCIFPEHPFSSVFQTPNLRRETAAQLTDAMRLLLMRGQGYEVTATEFVPSSHTIKNRLITCERRGNYFNPAKKEYESMKEALGGQGIMLQDLLEKQVSMPSASVLS